MIGTSVGSLPLKEGCLLALLVCSSISSACRSRVNGTVEVWIERASTNDASANAEGSGGG
jgi:hypothetical protein